MIVRSDPFMSPGKLAAQAGHAFPGAFPCARRTRPDVARRYRRDPPGTTIVLEADDPKAPTDLELRADARAPPPSRALPRPRPAAHLDDAPVVTALELWPVSCEQVRAITGDLALVP